MIILGIILALIGSLAPMDGRAKNAFVIVGIILVVVGAAMWLLGTAPYRYW